MASAPAALLAALQLHKTPAFQLSELLLQQILPEPPFTVSRAKAAGTHVVSCSARALTVVFTLGVKGSIVSPGGGGGNQKGERRTFEHQAAYSRAGS